MYDVIQLRVDLINDIINKDFDKFREHINIAMPADLKPARAILQDNRGFIESQLVQTTLTSNLEPAEINKFINMIIDNPEDSTICMDFVNAAIAFQKRTEVAGGAGREAYPFLENVIDAPGTPLSFRHTYIEHYLGLLLDDTEYIVKNIDKINKYSALLTESVK